MKYDIRPLNPEDRPRVAALIAEHWGDDIIVAHGTAFRPSTLPGFVACCGDRWLGIVTYHIAEGQCEVVTLNSFRPSAGIGTALLQAVRRVAVEAGCRRVWVVTTNDNINALRFYQKRGFRLVAVHRDAVEEARRLKPAIPQIGYEGIPIRDEIELEMALPVAGDTR